MPLHDAALQPALLLQPQCGLGFTAAVERAPEETPTPPNAGTAKGLPNTTELLLLAVAVMVDAS